MISWRKFANLTAVFILVGLIGMFLYYQLKLGLVRFLDLDEVAHLHWSYNASSGRLPYKDFLYMFTPFYLYLIAPIVFISGKTFAYVLGARVFSFIFFFLTLIILYLVAQKTKGALFALFTALIFSYLPMPADKWLEVRPDGLGTMLAFWGIWFLILTISSKANQRKSIASIFFLSGFFLSLGFVENPKTIFYLASAITIVAIEQIFFSKRRLSAFVLGLLVPLISLLMLFLFSGNFGRAIYLVFILPKEAGALMMERWPMKPDLFFYPNEVYYGFGGYQFNYLANIAIYLLAGVTSIIRLVSFLEKEGREKILIRLLLALLFITNLAGYVKFFPLKHTQYLITLSPFVAYFFADFVFVLGRRITKKVRWGKIAYGVFVLIFIAAMAYFGTKMHQVKASRTFAESELVYWESARNTFQDDEYVWDLTGGSLFYRDPYYICCTPYGHYEEAIKFRLPSLKSALQTHEVKHIFVQTPDRLGDIYYEHLELVNKYYVALPQTPSILYAGANVEFEKNERQKEFELIASGWYKIYADDNLVPVEQLTKELLLDGRIILTNPIFLIKGEYTLTRLGEEYTVKIVYYN